MIVWIHLRWYYVLIRDSQELESNTFQLACWISWLEPIMSWSHEVKFTNFALASPTHFSCTRLNVNVQHLIRISGGHILPALSGSFQTCRGPLRPKLRLTKLLKRRQRQRRQRLAGRRIRSQQLQRSWWMMELPPHLLHLVHLQLDSPNPWWILHPRCTRTRICR